MTHGWLPHTILHAASMLAPSEQRAEWLKGWRSELWYLPRRGAARFCLGAFRDAIWVRRNSVRPAWRTAFWFESPLSCLAFLTPAAIVSGIIVVSLPNPNTSEMFLAFALTLLPARITVRGGGVFRRHPAFWPNRLRRGIFLLLKFALVLPVMVSGWVVMIWIGPAARAGLVAQMANYTLWFLTLRWVLLDQRNRCPSACACSPNRSESAHRRGRSSNGTAPSRRALPDMDYCRFQRCRPVTLRRSGIGWTVPGAASFRRPQKRGSDDA